jgi:hypothetical protein
MLLDTRAVGLATALAAGAAGAALLAGSAAAHHSFAMFDPA